MIQSLEQQYQDGVPIDDLYQQLQPLGLNADKVDREVEKLRSKGEVYEPVSDHVRTT